MTGSLPDSIRLGDAFPDLQALAAVRIGSAELDQLVSLPGDYMILRRMQGRSQAVILGDILATTVGGMLGWPGIGVGRRQEILDFLGRANANASRTTASKDGRPFEFANVVDDPARLPEEKGAIEPHSIDREGASTNAWVRSVQILSAWATTVAGASTWADLICLADLHRPAEIEEAWQSFAASPLPLGNQSSAQTVLADFLHSGMVDRHTKVLLGRVVGPRRRTLDDLGQELGVTRERIRQIESKVQAKLKSQHANLDEWRSVRWATDALRSRLGAMAPLALREQALPAMGDDERRVVTWLAGYRYKDRFLVAESFERPTVRDLPRLVPDGRVIDEFETIEAMLAAGINRELVENIVDSIDGVTRIDGQLVDWTGGQLARAVAILELRDEPQGVEDLFELAGGESLTSFRNRIYDSDSIIRVTKSKVGLRSWGGTHYTSITDLMTQRLASGPMEIQALAEELERIYEISASSVVMYADAPAFKVTGNMVALRGRSDAFVPRNKPNTVQGLFQVAPDTLLWHLDVTPDLLRGSGRSLPHEIGTFLGLSPGDHGLVLSNAVNDVLVTWPETSFTGPNIGSLRPHVQALGACEGNILRLVFTAGSEQLRVALVPDQTEGESRAETLARLTAIPVSECHDLSALASAISTPENDVVNTLLKRKDAQVAMAAELVRLLSASR